MVNQNFSDTGIGEGEERDTPVQAVYLVRHCRAVPGGKDAPLFDLGGPEQRILITYVPHAGRMWFFKMTGPKDLVAAQKDAFKAFVTSVQFAGEK